MMRLTAVIIFSVLALPAGESTTPPPKPITTPDTVNPPPAINAETQRKAEAAADAYLKAASIRPDPEAELILADIEILLLEGRSFVDAKQPLKAGEKYLLALDKRKSIPPEQRVALGERMRKVNLQLLKLSRELLSDPIFDLGDPPAAAGQQPVPQANGAPPSPNSPPAITTPEAPPARPSASK